MTETKTAPLREEHRPRELTHAEFGAEGRRRFGDDPKDWAFACPNCGDVASARDFPSEALTAVGQECIGRHVEGRGCKTVAYGFFKGPWAITMADGSVGYLFALASMPSRPPQNASPEPEATPGPGNADAPPDAAVRPACGLSVERWSPDSPRGPEEWDYRVALTEHQAILGVRRIDEFGVKLLFADSEAWGADQLQEIDALDRVLAHIAQYQLPIGAQDLAHATVLIVEACAEDTAAKVAPAPEAPGAYWSVEHGWTDRPVIDCSCFISAPCARCESLMICDDCPTEVFVLEDEMDAHKDAAHSDDAEAEA